jgi:Protein of unknown function (DUF2924)
MRSKHRAGAGKIKSPEASIEDEIAHLRDLDLSGLRARWQSVFRRPPASHLPRHLLFAVLAFQIQADRFGDLDHETRKLLDRTGPKESGPAMTGRLESLDRKRADLTPGTVLVREWDRQTHVQLGREKRNTTARHPWEQQGRFRHRLFATGLPRKPRTLRPPG